MPALQRGWAGPAGRSAKLHAVSTGVYFMLNGDGDLDTAHRRLVEAIEANGGDFNADNPALIAAIDTLFQVCLWGGRAHLWPPYLARWRG